MDFPAGVSHFKNIADAIEEETLRELSWEIVELSTLIEQATHFTQSYKDIITLLNPQTPYLKQSSPDTKAINLTFSIATPTGHAHGHEDRSLDITNFTDGNVDDASKFQLNQERCPNYWIQESSIESSRTKRIQEIAREVISQATSDESEDVPTPRPRSVPVKNTYQSPGRADQNQDPRTRAFLRELHAAILYGLERGTLTWIPTCLTHAETDITVHTQGSVSRGNAQGAELPTGTRATAGSSRQRYCGGF
ncbi:hypothetical protein Bbelb_109870 [Branchiostoma belcheri]|nr:hypothetical protein Bbelb_109870 [Branchiostoma belcheri]